MGAEYLALVTVVTSLIARIFGHGDEVDIVHDGVDVGKSLGRLFGRKDTATNLASQVQVLYSELFATELRGIPDHDLSAATAAVASAVRLLSDKDDYLDLVTDSAKSEAHVLLSGGTRMREQLGNAGALDAFDLMLRVTMDYIAELTLRSPDFTSRALQRILRNNAAMARTLEVMRLEGRGVGEPSKEVEYTQRYLARVLQQLDFLDLPGVDLEPSRARYALTSAYTPLAFEVRGHAKSGETRLRIDDKNEVVFYDTFIEESLADEALSLANRSQSTLVIGDPGAGKTTITKWLAVELARDATVHSLTASRVPFLTKLRQCKLPLGPDGVGEPLTSGFAVPTPSGWRENLLKQGRCVLIFDGLDEVPADRRVNVVAWIDETIRAWCPLGNSVIVTSRPLRRDDALTTPRVRQWAYIEGLDAQRIQQLVHDWHQTVLASREGMDANTAAESAEALVARFEESPALSRLASNPLLCAVLCALHHRRRETLPEDRVDIYEAIVGLLLGKRDLERGIDLPALTYASTERIVERIAEEFLLRGEDEMLTDDLLMILRNVLGAMRDPTLRQTRPRLALEQLTARTGLIRATSESTSYFWHKSFQEYLAARSLVKGGRDGLLLEHAGRAKWREVIVWASAMLTLERVNGLVFGLLSVTGRADKRRSATLLAIECAHQALELDPNLFADIGDSVRSLMPPRSKVESQSIVSLGPPAVPYLISYIREAEASLEEESRILNCLIDIGGETADRALGELPSNLLRRHLATILAGWNAHRAQSYADLVLTAVRDLSPETAVHVGTLRQLRALARIGSTRPLHADLPLSAAGFDESLGLEVASLTLRGWRTSDALGLVNRLGRVRSLCLIDPTTDAQHLPRVTLRDIIIDSSGTLAWSDVDRMMRCVDAEHWTIRAGGIDVTKIVLPDQVLSLRLDVREPGLFMISIDSLRLQELALGGWAGESLACLGHLPGLESLQLVECDLLDSLDGADSFMSLRYVSVRDCSELSKLPEASNLDEIVLEGESRVSPLPHFDGRSYTLLPWDEMDVLGRRTRDDLELYAFEEHESAKYSLDDSELEHRRAYGDPWRIFYFSSEPSDMLDDRKNLDVDFIAPFAESADDLRDSGSGFLTLDSRVVHRLDGGLPVAEWEGVPWLAYVVDEADRPALLDEETGLPSADG